MLNVNGTPTAPRDLSVFSFSDRGSWFSYALPETPTGGFIGPYLMTDGYGIWLSQRFTNLTICLDGKPIDISSATNFTTDYLPGKLFQSFNLQGLKVEMTLIFATNRTSLISVIVTNNSGDEKQLSLGWRGDFWLDERFEASKQLNGIQLVSTKSETKIGVQVATGTDIKIDGQKYQFSAIESQVESGKSLSTSITFSACFSAQELEKEQMKAQNILNDPSDALADNHDRWNGYLERVLTKIDGNPVADEYQMVAVKSLNTLVNNWRSAANAFQYDGLFPSYAYRGFHGFWSWDSWKHAVALVAFEPELAKDQIRTMYHFQDEDGMIADCVYRTNEYEENNWRDTKPPLSGWAIHKVFEVTQDTAFVKELFPRLVKYHQWWYNYRDNNKNGLCEYGSTDGTRVAAAWESGMDNAVRFDEAVMVQNNERGWSLDQESVDLNSYLFSEKQYISKLAMVVGESDLASQYETETNELAQAIKKTFYDEVKGYFYDLMLDGKMIKIEGPEGWIPLWAGLADQAHADKVKGIIVDSAKFNTKVPFPTLTADHPKFNPRKGYWRGPVWLDQAYFGIKGLENYGYKMEAEELKTKLLKNAEGLMVKGEPIRENYHPITGEGLNANHFSWSAAHVLMMIRE